MILSASLRDGPARNALFLAESQLFAPEKLRREMEKHAPRIRERSGFTESEYGSLTDEFNRINWVNDSQIKPWVGEAEQVLAHVDPDDVVYLACALAVGADGIWSFDSDFDAQSLVPRFTQPPN